MSRETRHALLLLLGAVLVRVGAGETVLRYVRPGHRWLLIAAGVMVVGLAVAGVVADLRRRAVPPDPHGHDRAPWLLLLPVLVIGLVAPPALGADVVGRSGGAPVRGDDLYPPLPGGTPVLALGDVVDRAVWDESRSVAGREVVVTGFLARAGGDTVLARIRISCCAADARASTLRLRGTGVPVPDGDDRWMRVRGTVVPGTGTASDRYVPDLAVAEMVPIPPPPDPYET